MPAETDIEKRDRAVIAFTGEGAITVEVKHTGADSFLSGVIKLVQEAQASKSRTQDIANRAAFWLTVIALSVSGLTAFSWLFFTEQGVAFAWLPAVPFPARTRWGYCAAVVAVTTIAATNGLLIGDRTAARKPADAAIVLADPGP
jgi:Cu2+-exporting ATPase